MTNKITSSGIIPTGRDAVLGTAHSVL